MRKLIICMLLLICVGCTGKPDIEGIMLDMDENNLLIARHMTEAEYEQIKDVDPTTIQNEDVLGDTYYGLIVIQYDQELSVQKGDIVHVWIDGDIMESYPERAKAKKVKKK